MQTVQRKLSKQHKVVSTALCLLDKADDGVTETELATLKHTIEVLELCQSAIEELQDKNSSTLSVVIPLLKQMSEYLSKVHLSSFEFAQTLLSEIDQLLAAVQENFFVTVGTILDPCFKLNPFAHDHDRITNVEMWLATLLHLSTG